MDYKGKDYEKVVISGNGDDLPRVKAMTKGQRKDENAWEKAESTECNDGMDEAREELIKMLW